MKKLSIIAFLSLLLSACQTFQTHPSISMGTEFRLNHPLEFGASQVAVYIQHGQIVHANSVDDYKPNCTLEVKRKLAHPQTFRPDNFIINKVSQEIAGNTSVIELPHAMALGGASRYPEYITEIFLHSSRQPNMYKLTCQHLEEPENARHLTLNEIQNTLGDIMTIRSPH